MKPQELVDLLDARGHSPRGSEDRGWTARCPAHEDNRASLSIGVGDGGRVLVHCHAGCTTEAIAAALGLGVADLFDRERDPAGQPTITETYDYVNEASELLYQVVRFDPKDFRQRRPDGAGGWRWRVGDTRRVLYRLPEVLEAVKTGQRVWVVEGERDVHALEAVGEVATTNPGGAGKWRPEYSEALRGAKVTVIADRDEPGRKHAQAVATSLDGLAAEVRVVEPAEGKDARDHLGAGLTVADFVFLAPEPAEPPAGDEPVTGDWLAGSPMDPCAVPPDPVPAMRGYPFLPETGGVAALVFSPTGGGKSFLVETCAYDASLAGIRTLYLGHEVDETEFNARAAKIADARGDLAGQALRDALARVRYLDLTETMIRANAAPAAWATQIAERYDVVLIDPLSAVETALGLNFTQDNRDYVGYHDAMVRPLVAKGVRVVQLDNIGNSLEAKDRAKGVSAKQDRADLVFSCALGAGPVALIIKAGKVRSTRAPHRRGDEWLFYRDTLRIERRNGADEPQTAFRPTVLMEKISEALEADAGLSKRAIRAAVGGKAEFVDLALELLIAEDYVRQEKDGVANRHYSKRPYSADRVPVSRPCPDRVPDTDVETVSPCPDLKGGDTDTVHTTGHSTGPTVSRFQQEQLDDLRRRRGTLDVAIDSPAVIERRRQLDEEIAQLEIEFGDAA